MRHNPADPHWPGRDRFVLSCGHSSLTLYIQLYLGGWGLELDDLKALRTWGSKTPGHPEYGHTAGVETTTGPLGQGIGNAVGMAMAARRERGLLDPNAAEGASPFDHHIYALCSDGDIEEGVSAEASAIAGVQQLGNLTVIYDANRISIEDDTDIALAEDVGARYEAYGWHVQTVDWTHDETTYAEDVPALLRRDPQGRRRSPTGPASSCCARSSPGPRRPCRTPARATAPPSATTRSRPPRRSSASTPSRPSRSPTTCSSTPARRSPAARRPRPRGTTTSRTGPTKPSADAGLFERMQTRTLPDGWADALPTFDADPKGVATRGRLRQVHQRDRAGACPSCGAARPTSPAPTTPPSRASRRSCPRTARPRCSPATRTPAGCCTSASASTRMGAIMNGIAVHGGTRVFGGTFLTFSDYMRPARSGSPR